MASKSTKRKTKSTKATNAPKHTKQAKRGGSGRERYGSMKITAKEKEKIFRRKKTKGAHAKTMSATIDSEDVRSTKQSKAMRFMNAQTPTLNVMSTKRVAFSQSPKVAHKSPNGVILPYNPLQTRGRSRSAADALKKPPRKITHDDMKVDTPQRGRRHKAHAKSNKFTNKRSKSTKGKDQKKGLHAQVFFDDDLDLDEMRLMAKKADASGKRNSVKPMKIKKQNLSKYVLNKCGSDLEKSYKDDKKDILYCFKLFKQAINEQEAKLLAELEAVHNKKKRFLDKKTKDLETAKKRNHAKLPTISFDPNIALVLDKADALKQIEGFGYVNFYDDFDEEGTIADNKRLIKSKKQKKLLTKLQNETMSKLNAIIRMEEELRKKKSDAVRLRTEVEDDLIYIKKQQEMVQQRVKAAQPEIDAARDAVAKMDKSELNEIRSLKSPPAIIELAMTATCLVLGTNVKTWRDVQKRLDYKFVRDILEYDGMHMVRANRMRVERDFIAKEDFNYERVQIGSKVSGCMVKWVNSQVRYSKLLDDVLVMEQECKRLKKEAKSKLKLAAHYERITKELEISIGKYEEECQKMIANIINKTAKELKSHENSLNPVNAKFFDMLNIC